VRNFFSKFFCWRRIRLFIVYLLIFLLAGFIGNIWMTRNQASGQLPDVVFKDIDGVDLKLEFNRVDNISLAAEPASSDSINFQHKPTLLYFFAEWCPICKVQHSVISSISQHVRVVGIAMQSGDDEEVRKYVARQGIDFTVINDESGKLSRLFGVSGVPAAFIINNSGQIKYSTRGYTSTVGFLIRIWLTNDD
jgi:peroxiredoxin